MKHSLRSPSARQSGDIYHLFRENGFPRPQFVKLGPAIDLRFTQMSRLQVRYARNREAVLSLPARYMTGHGTATPFASSRLLKSSCGTANPGCALKIKAMDSATGTGDLGPHIVGIHFFSGLLGPTALPCVEPRRPSLHFAGKMQGWATRF